MNGLTTMELMEIMETLENATPVKMGSQEKMISETFQNAYGMGTIWSDFHNKLRNEIMNIMEFQENPFTKGTYNLVSK